MCTETCIRGCGVGENNIIPKLRNYSYIITLIDYSTELALRNPIKTFKLGASLSMSLKRWRSVAFPVNHVFLKFTIAGSKKDYSCHNWIVIWIPYQHFRVCISHVKTSCWVFFSGSTHPILVLDNDINWNHPGRFYVCAPHPTHFKFLYISCFISMWLAWSMCILWLLLQLWKKEKTQYFLHTH